MCGGGGTDFSRLAVIFIVGQTVVLCFVWMSSQTFFQFYPISHVKQTKFIDQKNNTPLNSNETNVSTRPLRVLFLSRIGNRKAEHRINMSIGERCEIMYDQPELYNISDVVIFKECQLSLPLPTYRPDGQRWVYHSWESGDKSFKTPQNKKNLRYGRYKFNYTMTYSVHSDIYVPYGSCVKVKTDARDVAGKIDTIVKRKTKLVAWIVSHCETTGMRENYVRELMKHIDVDVYGECGNKEIICPKSSCGMKTDNILYEYKFYLAFENTLNGEYVTEKLWKCFPDGAVPVVYGGLGGYKTLLPKHSYIDVTDFKSPAALATYLLKINSDDKLYRNFFSWKKNYTCALENKNKKMPSICDFLISAGQNIVDLTKVWDHPSTKFENATDYLKKLGVTDLKPRPFSSDE